jgi:hypothetical protein
MEIILKALRFCKENKLYDKHINIALGINKIPMTLKEGFTQIRMKK